MTFDYTEQITDMQGINHEATNEIYNPYTFESYEKALEAVINNEVKFSFFPLSSLTDVSNLPSLTELVYKEGINKYGSSFNCHNYFCEFDSYNGIFNETAFIKLGYNDSESSFITEIVNTITDQIKIKSNLIENNEFNVTMKLNYKSNYSRYFHETTEKLLWHVDAIKFDECLHHPLVGITIALKGQGTLFCDFPEAEELVSSRVEGRNNDGFEGLFRYIKECENKSFVFQTPELYGSIRSLTNITNHPIHSIPATGGDGRLTVFFDLDFKPIYKQPSTLDSIKKLFGY